MALLVGIAIGAASTGSTSSSKIDDLNAQLADARNAYDLANGRADQYRQEASANAADLRSVQWDLENAKATVADLRDQIAQLKKQKSEPVKTGNQDGTQPRASFPDGTYRVPAGVAPGTYRSTGGGGSCYWERLHDFTGGLNSLNANYLGKSPTIVTIQSTDAGFFSERCGTWVKIG